MVTNKFLITIAVLAIISMLASDASAQSRSKIYGYVRVDGLLTNNVTVKLSSWSISVQPFYITSNDSDDTAGYYEFIIENGSGNRYTVSASINNRSGSYSFIMQAGDWPANLSLSASPTPTPTPTPTATPTPRPSGEMGGMVIRNDSSSFIPMSALNPSMTPTQKPSRASTAAPAVEPTPTPTPAAGILSNVYVWLVIALAAVLAIAAAVLLYLKK